ncbi:MAG TPA: trypsin-like peptidase domain-containing protein [Casimicrobiaceae bacterium]|nr:trypsin-like peptidase domain-containing protein [Casimicrobiaceae bacterium]
MKKVALYSRSDRGRSAARRLVAPDAPGEADAASEAAAVSSPPSRRSRWRSLASRYQNALFLVAGGLFALALVAFHAGLNPPPPPVTQKDIDAAVLHTLENVQMPSHAAKAYEAVRRSVVRVRGRANSEREDGYATEGVGTGVVIVDTGIILTNLHVVAGADQVQVEFFDGMESEASVIGARPEHDLAVLQAKKLPDDLPAATLRSTADLAVGDEVVAVGFPFGIGPSASAGIVSGLQREYRSPQGKQVLTNLIQFDAAANPGNSGGPLVTADGEVVGIVTAILNPTEQSVFIGIGFAVPIENAAAAVGISPF